MGAADDQVQLREVTSPAAVRIRAAAGEDLPTLVAIGAEFYAASPNARYAGLCVDTCLGNLALTIDNGFVLVAEVDGSPMGFLSAIRAPSLIDRSVVGASEVYFFVGAAGQGRGTGRLLVDAAMQACRDNGLAFLQMHSTTGSPPQLEEIYRAAGFVHTETSFTAVI